MDRTGSDEELEADVSGLQTHVNDNQCALCSDVAQGAMSRPVGNKRVRTSFPEGFKSLEEILSWPEDFVNMLKHAGAAHDRMLLEDVANLCSGGVKMLHCSFASVMEFM